MSVVPSVAFAGNKNCYFSTIVAPSLTSGVLPALQLANGSQAYFSTVSGAKGATNVSGGQVSSIVGNNSVTGILIGTGILGSLSYPSTLTAASTLIGAAGMPLPMKIQASAGKSYFA
jgi:hypothetical protein